ncbi:MAG: hypothetical protein OSA98_18430 [Rubripirellula sp.]|nr:hypothetical protein [Rubripirellula sp.]
MTNQEQCRRDHQRIFSIRSVFRVHQLLKHRVDSLEISVENSRIVLRGAVPSTTHKDALVPAVRQAGVLGQIENSVRVETRISGPAA